MLVYVNPMYISSNGSKQLVKALQRFSRAILLEDARDLIANILGYDNFKSIPSQPRDTEVPFEKLTNNQWTVFIQHGIQSVLQKFPDLPSGHARTVVYSGLPKPRLLIGGWCRPEKDELALRIWEFTIDAPPESEEEFEEVEMEVYTFGQVCPKCEGRGYIDTWPEHNPLTSTAKPPKWPDNKQCSRCDGEKIIEEIEIRLTLLRASPSDGRNFLLNINKLEAFEDFLEMEDTCASIQGYDTYTGYSDDDEDNPDDDEDNPDNPL